MTETTKAKKPTLHERLAVIQKELKAPKNQFNKFANFNYRSCEDILEAVKPLLGDLVLTIDDEIVQVGDRYYVRATAILSESIAKYDEFGTRIDSFIKVSAYAREADSKAGMDVAQVTGASSSYARKYALNGLFLIDDTKDSDTQDNRTTTKTVAKPVAKPEVKEDPDELDFSVEPTMLAKCEVCGKDVSTKIESYSKQKYGKVLCMEHQLKEKK